MRGFDLTHAPAPQSALVALWHNLVMTIQVFSVGERVAQPIAVTRRLGYAVRPLKIKPPRPAPAISPEDKALFSAISDPANARLFSAEALDEALGDVQPD